MASIGDVKKKMSIYSEMQKIAQGLLSSPDFKQGSSFLVKRLPGTGPAYAPGMSIETLHPIDAAVRGAKFKYLQRNLAVATDLQVTFAASDNLPEPAGNDMVQIDGVRYKIIAIDRKPSSGVAVAFTLIVRK